MVVLTGKVAALGKYSFETLAQLEAARMVVDSLSRSVVRKANAAYLGNVEAAPGPTGLLNTTGIIDFKTPIGVTSISWSTRCPSSSPTAARQRTSSQRRMRGRRCQSLSAAPTPTKRCSAPAPRPENARCSVCRCWSRRPCPPARCWSSTGPR